MNNGVGIFIAAKNLSTANGMISTLASIPLETA